MEPSIGFLGQENTVVEALRLITEKHLLYRKLETDVIHR
jgi:hypothetical protein